MSDLRSQDEILARIKSLRGGMEDFFGFRFEALVSALDFEHARQFLRPEVTQEGWSSGNLADRHSVATVEREAKGYLEFAIGKISDHRGISASRSVEKLGEFAWLLGRDDLSVTMEATPYAQYGAPKVLLFAAGMGWDEIWEQHADEGVKRMARGMHCRPECDAGCGR